MRFWQWPRGLQLAAFAVPLLVLYSWQLRQELAFADRRVGMVLREGEAGVEVEEVVAGGPAQAAGLSPGDRLLEVAGQPIGKVRDYDRATEGFRRGQATPFKVSRQGHELTLPLTPGMAPDWLSLALNLVGALTYFLVALVSLRAPREDPRRPLLVLFAVAVAWELALPSFPLGPSALAQARQVAFYALTGWQLALELYLVALIPRRALWLARRPSLQRLFPAAGVAAAGLLTALAFLFPETPAPLGLEDTVVSATLNYLVLPSWALAVVGILLGQVRQAGNPLARQQALLVLLGTVPWAGYILLSGALQLAGMRLPFWAGYVQSLALLAFPVAVFVAVFRYRFLDFEHLVRRSLLYTSLTGSLVLLFYALVGAGSALLSEWIGGGLPVFLVSAATLVLGLLFSPLRSFLQGLIDQRFFPERYAQRQQLVQLVAELPSFGKVRPMAEHLVGKVAEVFSCPWVTLLVNHPGSQLLLATASTGLGAGGEFDSAFLLPRQDPAVEILAQSGMPVPASKLVNLSPAMAQRLSLFRAQWAVPVPGPRDLAGLLLVGGKQEDWGSEELALLSLLAHHLGTVLENARLFEAATLDGLTGLWRREPVLEQLEREWQRATRYGRPLAVAMADVDLFKAINDRYGHLAGDVVLSWVAHTLRQGLRASDFLGRYGGEEFLLVFPETDASGARAVAEKLRQRVAEGVIRLEGGQSLQVTVSFGVAAYEPGQPSPPASVIQLIQRADQHLLQAKEAGRNRVVG